MQEDDTREIKIEKTSEKGKKLSALMKQIKKCDKAADNLAIELGCKRYIPSVEADFGGISAFEFNARVDRKVWELIDATKDGKLYIPRVNTRNEILEKEKAIHLKGDNVMVGETDLPFSAVSLHFSREESARIAGVKLTTPSLDQLAKTFGLNIADVNKIRMNIPVETAIPSATDEQKVSLRLSHQEDTEIMSALENKKFRSVVFLSGNKKAIEIFRKMWALPVVPQGTLNDLADVANERFRCGIREEGDYIVIVAPDKSENPNC